MHAFLCSILFKLLLVFFKFTSSILNFSPIFKLSRYLVFLNYYIFTRPGLLSISASLPNGQPWQSKDYLPKDYLLKFQMVVLRTVMSPTEVFADTLYFTVFCLAMSSRTSEN